MRNDQNVAAFGKIHGTFPVPSMLRGNADYADDIFCPLKNGASVIITPSGRGLAEDEMSLADGDVCLSG